MIIFYFQGHAKKINSRTYDIIFGSLGAPDKTSEKCKFMRLLCNGKKNGMHKRIYFFKNSHKHFRKNSHHTSVFEKIHFPQYNISSKFKKYLLNLQIDFHHFHPY